MPAGSAGAPGSATTAYAEWYANSLKIPGSPTAAHHRATYGDAGYDDFIPAFNEAIRAWDPAAWAELFRRRAPATSYSPPSTTTASGSGRAACPHPTLGDFHAGRDLVGELAAAVRADGMRFGTYYSGGLDWTSTRTPIADLPDLGKTVIQDPAYVAYADAHWRELIDRYQTDVLWNDIAYPRLSDLEAIVAEFYQRTPDGLVNDRFQDIAADGTRTPPRPARHHHAGVHQLPRNPRREVGDEPRHRLLVRLQPGGGRGELHPDRRR